MRALEQQLAVWKAEERRTLSRERGRKNEEPKLHMSSSRKQRASEPQQPPAAPALHMLPLLLRQLLIVLLYVR
jgi:hypothetical protein